MPPINYETIPDSWKYPHGPYRQAPAEYGGEWWLVNPFTQSEPWLLRERTGPAVLPPAGFVNLFGPRPEPSEFRQYDKPTTAYRAARILWEQDLRNFRGAGVPPWADGEHLKTAQPIYEHWGLGEPGFYEGRYGWLTRFPHSALPREDFSAFNAIELPHLTVAAFQIKLLDAGQPAAERHPFVPKDLWGDEPELAA